MAKSRRFDVQEKNETKVEAEAEARAEARTRVADEAVLSAAILRGPQAVRRAPTVVAIEGKGSLRIAGLSAKASAALSAAGYKDAQSLRGFKAGRLGEGGNQVGLRDLDIIHRESVHADYKGLSIDGRLAAHLADNRVRPWEVAGFFTFCGGHFNPYPWTPKDVNLHGIKDRFVKEARPRDWRDLLAPHGGAVDPVPDWRVDPTRVRPKESGLDERTELLGAGDLVRVRVDADRVSDLLDARPTSENVGEMLVLSQALTAKGDTGTALRLATHAASVDVGNLDETRRYQVQALAPAVAFMAAGEHVELRLRAAEATLVSAKTGSRASEAAAREAVRAARQRADATFSAAARLHGPARETALQLAREQYLAVLAGGGLDKGQAKAALGVQAGAAVLDVVRAVSVAATGVTGAVQVRSAHDATFDGRTLPASGAAWLMGSGGLGTLADPLVKGHVLHAWGRLQILESPQRLLPAPPVGGDLFRFDFLLGEVRRLSDDVARIESLLTQFKAMLLDQALDKMGALSRVTEELARLVAGLVKRVEALAAAVPGVVDDLVSAARDRAVVIALVEALKAWPHERWIDLISAIADAVGNGDDPGAAALARVRSWVEPEIGGILQGVKAQLTATLQDLTTQIQSASLPPSLTADLAEAYRLAGMSDPTAQVIQPLNDALRNLDLVALAQSKLDELDVVTVPGWVEGLLLAYVVAPLIIAIGVFIGFAIVGGPIGAALAAAAIRGLIALGTEYVVSLVLRALGDALGLAAQLQAVVDRAVGQLHDLVGSLLSALADVGSLQGMLTGVTSLLKDVDALLPHEVAAAVMDALTTARDTILDNAQKMSMALQRSFFRETLEYVDVVPLSFTTALPQNGIMVGYADPRYGSSAEVAAVASAFETERVLRATDGQQVLTQVLSLRQLLGSAQDLQPLLAGLPVSFAITQAALDRVAPGLYKTLIKDVEVHLDFDVPPEAQATLQTVLGTADTLAGVRMDPALDGRVPGGGFPALPVVAGRVPTGVPALLTHLGESRVRLKPTQKLKDAYFDGCGRRRPQWQLPATLRGTNLLADPDPDANEAGWRHLQLLDRPEELLFSHFDVLSDGVRFVHPQKALKPFEHRGLVGSWRLEIPALVLGSVVHQLPPIRDVRLIVSTVASYDRRLADLVPQVPVAVTEPTPDATGLPTLQNVEELLNQLDTTIASLKDALEDTVSGLGTTLNGLVDVAHAVEEAMEEATDALNTATVVRLAGALVTPTAAGNTLQAVLLRTSTLSDQAQVLAGLAQGAWTVSGVDPAKVVRVVEVTLTAVTNAPLVDGTVITLPTAPATVGFVPAGSPPGTAPRTGTAVLSATGSSRIPGSQLGGSGVAPTNPNGAWTLQLPTGVPVLPANPAVTEALVGILLEMRP